MQRETNECLKLDVANEWHGRGACLYCLSLSGSKRKIPYWACLLKPARNTRSPDPQPRCRITVCTKVTVPLPTGSGSNGWNPCIYETTGMPGMSRPSSLLENPPYLPRYRVALSIPDSMNAIIAGNYFFKL